MTKDGGEQAYFPQRELFGGIPTRSSWEDSWEDLGGLGPIGATWGRI